ncbi:hypothetical protein [Caulobacter sp.]|uniref:hypothetical protein n=1 Tax=Caulobacter sp. TaxID=78 RepID=UPI0031E214A3
MRDPQGREITRTSTHMRAAFGSALMAKALTFSATSEAPQPPLYSMVLGVFASGAGRKKAPAWTVSRKGARA